MKALREFDINGAPLLFLAASTRSTSECFHTVFHVLRAFLGTGGLQEQFKAHDHQGRNILMYAARSKDKDIFTFICDMDRELFTCAQRHDEKAFFENGHDSLSGKDDSMEPSSYIPVGTAEKEAMPYLKERKEPPWAPRKPFNSAKGSIEAPCKCCSSAHLREMVRNICRLAPSGVPVATQYPCQDMSTRETRSPETWTGRVVRRDRTGKNILHHAAEAASLAVLILVLDLVRDVGDVQNLIAEEDVNGRTPIMIFLRNKYDDDDKAHAKMTMLLENAGTKGWMQQRQVPPFWKKESTFESGGQSQRLVTRGKTELFHAAHGGLVRLELAIEFIWKTTQRFERKGFGDRVSLDKMLDMKIDPLLDEIIQENQSYESFNNLPRGKWVTKQSQKIAANETLNEVETARSWGNGMLLAAAVKGGHKEAIEMVVDAIKVSIERRRALCRNDVQEAREPYCFTRTNDLNPNPHIKQMGYFCLGNKAEKRQGNTEAVVAAIDTIRKSGRSLFKLAVMSGKANVVDYVYRKIICNYFQDQSQVIMNI